MLQLEDRKGKLVSHIIVIIIVIIIHIDIQNNWTEEAPQEGQLLSRKRQKISNLTEKRIFSVLWVVNKIWCQSDKIQSLKHVNFAWSLRILKEWKF